MKEDKSEYKKNNLRCKRCGSTLTYIRIGTNERVCRACGHTEDLETNIDKIKQAVNRLRKLK